MCAAMRPPHSIIAPRDGISASGNTPEQEGGMRTCNRAATAALLVFIATMVAVDRAWAQIDLSGEWAVRLHEDQLHRNDVLPGGLAIGDYTGLPINDAARLKADSWDASILSTRERQTI